MKHKCRFCGGESPPEDVRRERDKEGPYYICWKCAEKGIKLTYARRSDFMRTYKGRQLKSKERV